MHSRTSPLVTKIKVSGQGKQFKPDILIINREQTRVSLVLFLKFSSATSLNFFFLFSAVWRQVPRPNFYVIC